MLICQNADLRSSSADILLLYSCNVILEFYVAIALILKNAISVIMSKTHSPTHFNGDIDNFYDPNFPVDMNTRMRVPKSIRVNGDYPDEDIAITNRVMWNDIPMEKLEMHVPDRILVVGMTLFQMIRLFCIYYRDISLYLLVCDSFM